MGRYIKLIIFFISLLFAQKDNNDCFSGPIDSDGRPNGFGSIKVPIDCFFWSPGLVIETEWINGVSKDYFQIEQIRHWMFGGENISKNQLLITKLYMSDECWNNKKNDCYSVEGCILVDLDKKSILFGEMTGNGMLEGSGIMYNSSPIGAPEIGKYYTDKYTNSLSGQFSIATVDEWITKEDQYGIFNPKSENIVFDSLRIKFPDMDFKKEFWGLQERGFDAYVYDLKERYSSLKTIIKKKDLQNIAVVDFKGYNISEDECKALTDRLRRELFETKSFQVIEREMMEQIMEEKKFQNSGCVTDVCIVEIGEMIGVGKIVGGSISKVGSTYSVSSRIVSVETGKILKAATYDYKGEIDELLTTGMKMVAYELIK